MILACLLEGGFNYIDLNYEPFDRAIYNFTQFFETFGYSRFSTLPISILISITYVFMIFLLKVNSLNSKLVKSICSFLIFSFSFTSIIYAFQIFDLPRSDIMVICILFIPINFFYNLIGSKFYIISIPLLVILLIYNSNIMLPVDELSEYIKDNFESIEHNSPIKNIDEKLDKELLYDINSEVYFKEQLSFSETNKFLDLYYICCEEYDFYNQNMRNVGYLELFLDNVFFINGFGDLFYFNLEKMIDKDIQTKLIRISSNIEEVISNEYIFKDSSGQLNGQESIKGFQIHNEKMYISYIEEKSPSCVTLGILFGDISFDDIKFESLISFEECIERENANVQVSGGKMLFEGNILYLTVGDFGQSKFAQNENSIFGKILKINLDNLTQEIVSLGHRNPQGIEFTSRNNLIIETEHGARYGDEVNLIDLKNIENFGNPISSYSVHYGDITGKDIFIEEQPFNKSHKEYGFKEPIYVWGPDMPGGRNGVGDIIKNYFNQSQESFFIASYSARYLYEINLNISESSIEKIIGYKVGNRIRDIEYIPDQNKYLLILENPPLLAVFYEGK